jgi:hypothetical protein
LANVATVDVVPVDVVPVDVVPVDVVPLELAAATTSIVAVPVIEGLVLLSVKVTVSVPTAPTVTWYVATPLVNVSVAVAVVDADPSKVVTVIVLVPL